MNKPVRVRIAPSPTGFFHVGNMRTALFDYLVAKQTGGTFILRIEDTDQDRLVPKAAKVITDSLEWLGLEWQEGMDKEGPYAPYVQSQRLEIYMEHANQLLKEGKAYRDFTTPEQLEALRREAQKAGKPFKFTKDMAVTKPQDDEPGVIRFATTEGPSVTWEDAVWGKQQWEREVLDDFVCIKSDGYPTYNFANVIDDYLMKVDLVLRGQEFLPTTPKNLLVYEAFGWPVPTYAHAPWVLGPDKAKLSKRHGAKSVLEYRDAGYMPEALVNFLASLGWNDGTEQELFTLDELIKKFSLKRIQKSPAVFDAERLDWMNGLYIRELFSKNPDELLKRSEPFWPEVAGTADEKYKREVFALVFERLKHLDELPGLTNFFFEDPEIDWGNMRLPKGNVGDYLEMSLKSLKKLDDYSVEGLENYLRHKVATSISKEVGEHPGPLFMSLRIALTGKTATPGLFETMSVLGKDTVLRRLAAAVKNLA